MGKLKYTEGFIGTKIGKLTAIKYLGLRSRRATFLWVCECGNEKIVQTYNVLSGTTKSCGCVRKETAKTQGRKNASHGRRFTPEYRAWIGMKKRCSPNDKWDSPRYFDRGIKVCARWTNSFENFYADMGPRPSPKHSIDRINNNSNYEPGNCRWATWNQQARNRSNTPKHLFNGMSLCVAEIAEHTGIPRKTINSRLCCGWSLNAAATTPVAKRVVKPK